ncbi:MAG: DUF2080 family transposase-associated protein [Desulfarculaceae bacterium]|nr:DUF2080 family transposase-associated protein [Desulfarculaceae bacterium]
MNQLKRKPASLEPRPLKTGLPDQVHVKFEVFGQEMIEKEVKRSSNSGRVYLPSEWVGKSVKIIRVD